MGLNKTILLLLSILVLSACAPAVPLQRGQTASFAKGLPIEEASRLTDKATIVTAYEFDSNGKHYLAKHFDLQTGTRQEMAMVCTPTCISYPIFIPVSVPYVMIYEGERKMLFAWGTVEELSRSPDENISSIMPDLKSRYDQEMAKKKNS